MKSRHKFGAGLAAIALATGGISLATASPAAAAVTCGPTAPDKDTGTAQVINRDPAYPTGVAMRTGPGSNCSLIVRVPWSAWVDLNCYRIGQSVNGYTTWSAVHYAQYFGWISDAYLSGAGTNKPCAS
ncbi:hypothetical protein ACWGKQ_37710 [Streptomyces sp. NPDC054770]